MARFTGGEAVKRPTVTVRTRQVWTVEWEWEAPMWDGDSHDLEYQTRTHRKNLLTRAAAYRHAAFGYILDRLSAQGCRKERCFVGSVTMLTEHEEQDTRCKFCRPESRERILKRLARWLQWRDERSQCSKS